MRSVLGLGGGSMFSTLKLEFITTWALAFLLTLAGAERNAGPYKFTIVRCWWWDKVLSSMAGTVFNALMASSWQGASADGVDDC